MPTDNSGVATKAPPFDPKRVERLQMPQMPDKVAGPDRRDGAVYVYHDDDIALAVNAALVTKRPLLVSGPSGGGKSSLALNVALSLRRRYYEFVVTSSSDARDLVYRFDAVRRLNDAHADGVKHTQFYIEPGPLWWAIDPASARQRGPADVLKDESDLAVDPSPTKGDGAVVLIDEIDKADPDFPNNLLVPIGSLALNVAEISFRPPRSVAPLIIITNNAERDLPVPFLRRCIALNLPEFTEAKLVEIAEAHIDKHDIGLFKAVATQVIRLAQDQTIEGARRRLSAAEYLDTVRACQELGIRVDSKEFARLSRITLRKPVSATSEAP